MNSCWVNISEDQAFFMEFYHCTHKLSKYGKNLNCREGPFGKRFPVLNVVGAFLVKDYYTLLTDGSVDYLAALVEVQ